MRQKDAWPATRFGSTFGFAVVITTRRALFSRHRRRLARRARINQRLRRKPGFRWLTARASRHVWKTLRSAILTHPLASKPAHFPARMTRQVIFLFMNGGPSHVDTFGPQARIAAVCGPGSARQGR